MALSTVRNETLFPNFPVVSVLPTNVSKTDASLLSQNFSLPLYQVDAYPQTKFISSNEIENLQVALKEKIKILEGLENDLKSKDLDSFDIIHDKRGYDFYVPDYFYAKGVEESELRRMLRRLDDRILNWKEAIKYGVTIEDFYKKLKEEDKRRLEEELEIEEKLRREDEIRLKEQNAFLSISSADFDSVQKNVTYFNADLTKLFENVDASDKNELQIVPFTNGKQQLIVIGEIHSIEYPSFLPNFVNYLENTKGKKIIINEFNKNNPYEESKFFRLLMSNESLKPKALEMTGYAPILFFSSVYNQKVSLRNTEIVPGDIRTRKLFNLIEEIGDANDANPNEVVKPSFLDRFKKAWEEQLFDIKFLTLEFKSKVLQLLDELKPTLKIKEIISTINKLNEYWTELNDMNMRNLVEEYKNEDAIIFLIVGQLHVPNILDLLQNDGFIEFQGGKYRKKKSLRKKKSIRKSRKSRSKKLKHK